MYINTSLINMGQKIQTQKVTKRGKREKKILTLIIIIDEVGDRASEEQAAGICGTGFTEWSLARIEQGG